MITTEQITLPLTHVCGVKSLVTERFSRGNTVKYAKLCMLSVQVATDNLSFTRGMGEGVASIITTPSPMGCILGIS